MPEVDLTVTISTILGVSAIISPVLTSIINNIHQRSMRKLELKQKRYEQNNLYKRTIYENFLRAFNKVCQLHSHENIALYAESYSLAYIYVPDHVRKDLGAVNLLISKGHWEEAIKYVDAISMDIYKEMQKL